MKKFITMIFLVITLMTLINGCASTNFSAQDILDYFPAKIGNTWTYTNEFGLNETCFIQDISKRDIPLYLMVSHTTRLGQTSTLYGLENNKIVKVAFKNIIGDYQANRRPYPIILSSPEQKWAQNEELEYYLFTSSKSGIKYDDKNFDDCILIKQEVYIDNILSFTKKSYFARSIGLVYVSIKDEENYNEYCLMKLKNCNFTSLASK